MLSSAAVRNRDPLPLAILSVLAACSAEYQSEGCYALEDRDSKCADPADVNLEDLRVPGCGIDREVVDAHGPIRKRRIPDLAGTPRWSCCYKVDVVERGNGGTCTARRDDGNDHRDGNEGKQPEHDAQDVLLPGLVSLHQVVAQLVDALPEPLPRQSTRVDVGRQ